MAEGSPAVAAAPPAASALGAEDLAAAAAAAAAPRPSPWPASHALLFPLGGAVPPEHLVGRDTLVDQLAGWLAEGFRVVLTGPRRCGKSSVAAAAAARLTASGVPVAWVDLGRCATLRDAAEHIRRACAGWADGAAGPGEDGAPEEVLASALVWPEQAAARAGADACALVLDGCEHLERLGGLDALRRARPLLARQERTGYLFCGAHGRSLGSLAGTRAAPFALPLGMQPPRLEAWRPYLQQRLTAAGMSVADDGLGRLLERTGGHPFDLMAVCRAIAARPGRGRRLTKDRVDRAVREVAPLLGPLLQAEAAALGPARHGILQRLACNAHIYREAGPPASIKRAMDELVAGGVLRRGRRGEYAFTEPLLALALRGELG